MEFRDFGIKKSYTQICLNYNKMRHHVNEPSSGNLNLIEMTFFSIETFYPLNKENSDSLMFQIIINLSFMCLYIKPSGTDFWEDAPGFGGVRLGHRSRAWAVLRSGRCWAEPA